jgi:hypothetical protein
MVLGVVRIYLQMRHHSPSIHRYKEILGETFEDVPRMAVATAAAAVSFCRFPCPNNLTQWQIVRAIRMYGKVGKPPQFSEAHSAKTINFHYTRVAYLTDEQVNYITNRAAMLGADLSDEEPSEQEQEEECQWEVGESD